MFKLLSVGVLLVSFFTVSSANANCIARKGPYNHAYVIKWPGTPQEQNLGACASSDIATCETLNIYNPDCDAPPPGEAQNPVHLGTDVVKIPVSTESPSYCDAEIDTWGKTIIVKSPGALDEHTIGYCANPDKSVCEKTEIPAYHECSAPKPPIQDSCDIAYDGSGYAEIMLNARTLQFRTLGHCKSKDVSVCEKTEFPLYPECHVKKDQPTAAQKAVASVTAGLKAASAAGNPSTNTNADPRIMDERQFLISKMGTLAVAELDDRAVKEAYGKLHSTASIK